MVKKIFVVLFWFTALLAIIEGRPQGNPKEDFIGIWPTEILQAIAWNTPVRICGPQEAILEGKITCDHKHHDKQKGNLRVSYSGGIASECCSTPCTPMYILQYCGIHGTKLIPLELDLKTILAAATASPELSTQTVTIEPKKSICDRKPEEFGCGIWKFFKVHFNVFSW